MAYIKNTWVDQEVERPKTYEMVNNSDGSVTLVDSFGLVSELGTPVNADNMNHIEEGIEDHDRRLDILEGEGARADVNLSNLTEQGEKHFLNKQQITNCLLEVPQRIKLELNNGALTLKAGSVVIVPNGVGGFNEVSITSDISFPYLDLGSRTALVSIRPSASAMQVTPIQNIASGTSTTSSGLYYNTSENKIYRNGVFDGESLPIAKVTYVSGKGVTSIDEVFNGMGYMGSTVWVDKGVKALIPDGRNEDGTLNNREDVTTKVYTVTDTGTHNNWSLVLNKDGLYILQPFQTVNGSQPTTSGPCYTIETNKVYNNSQQRYWVHLANFSTNTGVFTNLDFKLPFRAVDYNDALTVNNKAEIIGWGMPDYTAGVAKSISETHTADRDGIVILSVDGNGGSDTIVCMYVNGALVNRSQRFMRDSGQGWNCWALVPKGATYNATSSFSGNLFFYPMIGVK